MHFKDDSDSEATLHLYTLIQSLTASEKRFFTIKHSKPKKYRALFDIVCNQSLGTIQKTFENIFPNASYEMARKQLYTAVLDALSEYASSQDSDLRLIRKWSSCIVLFNKGLYAQCLEQLKQIINLAQLQKNFAISLMCNQLQKQIWLQTGYVGISETKLVAHSQMMQNILQNELQYQKQNQLSHVLHNRFIKSGYAKSNREKDQLNDLLLEEFQLQNQQNWASEKLDLDHLFFQAGYFKMTNNIQAASRLYSEMLQKLAQGLKHNPSWVAVYLRTLEWTLSELYFLMQYETIQLILKQVPSEYIQHKSYLKTLHWIELKYKLAVYSATRQVEYIHKILSIYATQKHLMPSYDTYESTLILCRAYVETGQLTKALQTIVSTVQIPRGYTDVSTIGIHRMLFICIHSILAHDDVVQFELRSICRKFPKRHITSNFVRQFITQMQQSLKHQNAFNPFDILIHIASDIQDPLELRILAHLPLQTCKQLYSKQLFDVNS